MRFNGQKAYSEAKHNIELECTLCGDANPCWLERQGCSGWHDTVDNYWQRYRRFNHEFGNSPKIHRLADPVPLTLDLLNPKSTGFHRLSRSLLLCQVSNHSDRVLFYHANIHTRIVSKWSQYLCHHATSSAWIKGLPSWSKIEKFLH